MEKSPNFLAKKHHENCVRELQRRARISTIRNGDLF
jgi:hypothetical protein